MKASVFCPLSRCGDGVAQVSLDSCALFPSISHTRKPAWLCPNLGLITTLLGKTLLTSCDTAQELASPGPQGLRSQAPEGPLPNCPVPWLRCVLSRCG